MEQAQQDFLTAKRAPSRILNPFNEAIVSLMNGDKEETVSMSLDKYNILVDTNKLLAEKILGKRDFSNVVLKNTDVMWVFITWFIDKVYFCIINWSIIVFCF